MTVIALPDIAIELNFSAEALLWVNIIYMMSFVAFSLPFAKIISQYGVKKSTKISLLLLFFSILISVFSINDIMFLLSRLIQGFSAAALAISLYVIIVEEFEDSEIGSALGVVSSAGYIGLLIAPVVMGLAIVALDWKWAFLMVLLILVILLILLNGIDYEWATEKKHVDNKGSLIYVVMMCLFTYGMTLLDEFGIVFVVISVILLIILFKVEKNVPEPIFNFQLLKDVLFPALENMHKCLFMADYMLQHIIVKENILDSPIYDYLFTVEEVNRRTLEGTPFRDAYKKVGLDIEAGKFTPNKNIQHTHEGSIGNLCNQEIAQLMDSIVNDFHFERIDQAMNALLS